MPQGKLDEVAPLVLAFNHMADEVQRLVENLRRSDQSRRQMLQDLAHDLRTPLASLKTFLETMVSDGERLTPARRQEIMRLCLSEVDYFSNLVEDLLFLAQITEPKYAKTVETIDLQEELKSQMHVFRERHPSLNFEVHVPAGAALLGSQRLVTRMLRNALSNACSFAKTRVSIQVAENENELRVVFLDDGPGFSEKALQEFGHKKASREISGGADQKRISVGIGSLIMCEIASLHGGSAVAENRLENGLVKGAQVTFRLAKS
jgi:signal transduction histidine kinase